MKNVVIYGCGTTGKRIYRLCKERYNVVAFTDSNINLWGKKLDIDGKIYEIISPKNIGMIECERILLASMMFTDKVLLEDISARYDIPLNMMSDEFLFQNDLNLGNANIIRERFLRDAASLLQELEGSVAEGGVYAGEFSAVINEAFPQKRLHLFDTFEGFDKRDILVERANNFSSDMYKEGFLTIDGFSVDKLLKRMPYPQNVVVHKGYFPDTTYGDKDLEKEDFVFVNLDFDLYQPTKAGLEFFWPKLVKGGIILIHDYFSENYLGPRQAVKEFSEKFQVPHLPIGDGICAVIVKS